MEVKIKRYQEMGFRAFIFSGYPHESECKLFAQYVLPKIKTVSMPIEQNRRLLEVPDTPLGRGIRT